MSFLTDLKQDIPDLNDGQVLWQLHFRYQFLRKEVAIKLRALANYKQELHELEQDIEKLEAHMRSGGEQQP